MVRRGYRRIVTIQPDVNTPAGFVAALRARNPVRAASIALAMARANLDLKGQWAAVARFAVTEAEWPLAIDAMRRFVADDPRSIDRRLAFAEMLANGGRVAEAQRVLEALARTAPGDARARHFLGVTLLERGERDAGLEQLRHAVAIRPSSGATWLALANARRFTAGDAELDRLLATGATMSREPAGERAAWCYAAGKAWDELGEHARAFAAFSDGARLVASERRHDMRAEQAAAMATIARPQWVPGVEDSERHRGRAVFVTGKPRSGTTLVAQVLGAHSRVGGSGEINLLGTAAVAVGLGGDAEPGDDAWRRLRQRYAYLLDARFGPGEMLVIDKSLNTSRFAGMLRRALPEAPLIWLRRDPLDTAWSSFRTFFARGLGWSFDLAAMGRYHAIEDRLHAFWAEEYGPRLLTLDYRAFVDNPAAGIVRVLAHAGLTDEPGVRDFHLARGTVQTASVDQVRRPVNRAGIDSAAPYRAYLGPYLSAYEQSRRELGLPQLT